MAGNERILERPAWIKGVFLRRFLPPLGGFSPEWILAEFRIPHRLLVDRSAVDGCSLVHVTPRSRFLGESIGRRDARLEVPGVYGAPEGCQSVGTDDRSASSSGSMTRPTSESSTPTPLFLSERRRKAGRSNSEIRSRRDSHASSISCYERCKAGSTQARENTIAFPRRVTLTPPFERSVQHRYGVCIYGVIIPVSRDAVHETIVVSPGAH